MISVKNAGGGENLTALINEQPPIVADIIESLVGKATGANATAETILEGYSAYVGQELVEGSLVMPEAGVDLLSATGCTKMAVDKITFSTPTGSGGTGLPHSLGVEPQIAILLSSFRSTATDRVRLAFLAHYTGQSYTARTLFYGSTAEYTAFNTYRSSDTDEVSATKVFMGSNNYYYEAGVEYTLITMA